MQQPNLDDLMHISKLFSKNPTAGARWILREFNKRVKPPLFRIEDPSYAIGRTKRKRSTGGRRK